MNRLFETQGQRRLDITATPRSCATSTLPTEHLPEQVAESFTTEVRWVKAK